jgi:hypothetical protein
MNATEPALMTVRSLGSIALGWTRCFPSPLSFTGRRRSGLIEPETLCCEKCVWLTRLSLVVCCRVGRLDGSALHAGALSAVADVLGLKGRTTKLWRAGRSGRMGR